ncbi:predicted protein [Histoplasma capsulatum var. duboisii H88]|uniref:Predicted protein n=1 Tax=Ajellomyces capsulatus (strain H88) TaxID=544711 RepID=F0UTQ6_AJEC8|nr:predicted protein [Histoplasma capsulatum var. duboisii H88]
MAGLRGNFAPSTGSPNLVDCLEFSNSNNPIENHRPVRIYLVLRKQESQVQISPTLLSGNMGMRDVDERDCAPLSIGLDEDPSDAMSDGGVLSGFVTSCTPFHYFRREKWNDLGGQGLEEAVAPVIKHISQNSIPFSG